ncbi:type IV pilus modification PilV family protein [Schumannella soli]|uniref:Prepilin-type N-terminal cleavage/methylation domain-containing protein n=1 Tax=Schumannella soli TaxID=2590779 RepID=A0A506Y301_9MICO|nr:hypothetical protein [Schumannella soli]TPW74779.1 hypothetical protein FJ657_14480 [Schumannella soli]
MSVAARLREAKKLPQRGASLPELLTALMVTGLLLAMVAALFVQTGKIGTASIQNGRAASQAGNIMNAIETPVRVASNVVISGGTSPAVQEAKQDGFTLLALTDVAAGDSVNAATKYQFFVTTAGELKVTVCGVSITSVGISTPSSCNSPRTRVAGSGLTSTAIFTYNDSSGNAIAFSSGAIAAGSLKNIASITVTASVVSGTGQTPVAINTTIPMPNLGLSSTS